MVKEKNKAINFSYSFSNRLLKLLVDMSDKEENISISPSRLQAVLVMIANWAEPAIKEKILKVMSEKLLDIKEASRLCGKDLYHISPAYEEDEDLNPLIELNTFFWLKDGLQINSGALDQVSLISDVTLKSVDFKKPETKSIIDEVVERTSHGLIKGIDGDIPPDTLALITDVLYFKAQWEDPFDEYVTKDQLFYGTLGKQKVPMMKRHDRMGYCETDKCQMVKLDYICKTREKKRFSMRVILPKKGVSMEHALQDMRANRFYERFEIADVKLSLPRFSVESKTQMKEVFEDLGLGFVYESKDIIPKCVKNLQISDIFQQVKVIVNEEGTEAAALTVVVEMGCCPPMYEFKPIVMKVNRPFIFEVSEDVSNTILFTGVINNI